MKRKSPKCLLREKIKQVSSQPYADTNSDADSGRFFPNQAVFFSENDLNVTSNKKNMETRKISLNLKYNYLAKSILLTSIMHCIIIHLELYERIHRALQQSKMQDSTSFIG